MWELLAIGAGSFTVALSGALMPGPLLTITITESVRRGFRAGPWLMTGHAVLELVVVVAVVLGLGPFLKKPTVMGAIALGGGAFLLMMGVDMVRSATRLSFNLHAQESTETSGRHPVVLGVLASLANPYWTLWWATIGLGYLVTAMKVGPWGVGCFFVGHVVADFAWYSLVSLGVTQGTRFLGDRSYRWVLRFCGLFLVGFGAWFLWSAKSFLSQAFA
ncbi:LysE family transporter [Desulfosoma caldarium]|uniref:Threonine/homoserine/homoserine lactone efflux protein n=1 Tax=Desulfosoma caldarium TaxID=610254 RepID=A0A3N1UMB8_9BACT|nr:LysE family transporter [Desulfosoma caldarium]ROQ91223.1 threonine/homoserine/homoserine lactone efflux protein [Desulfosoma caldarium]